MASPLKERDESEKETSKDSALLPNLFLWQHDEADGSPQSKSDVPGQTALEGKLKKFGKKARALLQEQKQKRPEIKMLDPNEATKVSQQKRARSVALPGSKKPTRPTKRRKVSPQRRKSDVLSIIPLNVSHIPIPEKEFRSNIVKLHGLQSTMCTIEHVKRFFTGLKTESIFMVLPNQAYISALDIRSDLMIHEFNRNHTRTFVKFESSTLATLAAERSGETIKIADERKESGTKTLSIGVTLVNKEIAKYMLGMSISAGPGIFFHQTLSDIKKKLHPMVSTILWKKAAAKLEFALEKKIALFDLFGNGSDNPAILKGYKKLAQHHNRLVELHDEFLHQLPFPSVEPFDTDLSRSDPTVRLTSAASKVLVKEIDRIARLLHQGRVTARLERQKSANDG